MPDAELILPEDVRDPVDQDASDHSFLVTLQVRAKHADLLAASRKLGSIKALAEHLDVPYPTLQKWITLTEAPPIGSEKSKRWSDPVWVSEIERKLLALTGKLLDELFPDIIRSRDFLDAPKVMEATGMADVRRLSLKCEEVARLPAPEIETAEQHALASELSERINRALGSLTFREREVIKLRFGLGDGHAYTQEETGRVFKIGKARVSQIEIKAMRKLQESSRSDALLEVFDPAWFTELMKERQVDADAIANGAPKR